MRDKIELKIERLKKIENYNDQIGNLIESLFVKIGFCIEFILAITIFLPIPLIRLFVRYRIKKLRNKLKNN